MNLLKIFRNFFKKVEKNSVVEAKCCVCGKTSPLSETRMGRYYIKVTPKSIEILCSRCAAKERSRLRRRRKKPRKYKKQRSALK